MIDFSLNVNKMTQSFKVIFFVLLDECEDVAVRIEDLCPILAGSGYCNKLCLLGSWTQAACRKSCEQCAPPELSITHPPPTGPGTYLTIRTTL